MKMLSSYAFEKLILYYVLPQELLEKKVLKTGPYRPNSGREAELPTLQAKEIRRDWNNEAAAYKACPYILGYTGKTANF